MQGASQIRQAGFAGRFAGERAGPVSGALGAGPTHCPCCTQGPARGECRCPAPGTFLALMQKALRVSLLSVAQRRGRRSRVALCCRSCVPRVRLACELCSLHSKFCFQVQRVLRLCLDGPAKDIFRHLKILLSPFLPSPLSPSQRASLTWRQGKGFFSRPGYILHNRPQKYGSQRNKENKKYIVLVSYADG